MSTLVYLTIFLIPTLFIYKCYKDYKLTKLKHEIIHTIDIINGLDRENLKRGKKEYPEFYRVIRSIFNKDFETIEFEQIEKSIKKVDRQVSKQINDEIKLAVEKEGVIEFILLYRQLCILIYFYKNFKKYLLVDLVMKVVPEKERKKVKEKEEEKASDLCLA
ncbi:hypothetical protein [Gemella morbillorum]